jgi:hypothetical protein
MLLCDQRECFDEQQRPRNTLRQTSAKFCESAQVSTPVMGTRRDAAVVMQDIDRQSSTA